MIISYSHFFLPRQTNPPFLTSLRFRGRWYRGCFELNCNQRNRNVSSSSRSLHFISPLAVAWKGIYLPKHPLLSAKKSKSPGENGKRRLTTAFQHFHFVPPATRAIYRWRRRNLKKIRKITNNSLLFPLKLGIDFDFHSLGEQMSQTH